MEITIRPGEINDTQELIGLNKKYVLQGLSSKEKIQGYITLEFSENDFLLMVDNNHIVVAINDNNIVGYYLLYQKAKTDSLHILYKIANTCKYNNRLLSDYNLGIGCQVIIDEKSRNSGTFNKLLTGFKGHLKNRYDILLAKIEKSNQHSLKVCTREGWQVVGEDQNVYFVILDLL